MNIGIVGNYGHDNNGDEAILQGILQQLTVYMNVPLDHITVFSNHPENTRKRYGVKSIYLLKKKGSLWQSAAATLWQHRHVVKKLDYLIIGGGGIIMDMYKRDAPLYSSIAFLGKLYRCKIIVYGVGAGPIATKPGRFLLKGMLQSAKFIAVRDEKSKLLLESLGLKKQVHLIADPAFTLTYEGKKELKEAPMNVGVTAVPYFSKEYWPVADEDVYHRYVNGMAANLDELIERFGVHIHFFSTKYPQDIKVTEQIQAAMKHGEQATVNRSNLYPNELISIAGDMDLVIGTRLHSLILAVAAGTPIIGVNYHPKVKAFMEKAELSGHLAEIDELTDRHRLASIVEQGLETGWKRVQLDVQELSDQLREEALQGVQLMKSVME